MTLCEVKDNRLVDAKQGGYLDVYCVGVINNLWNHRDRVKRYSNGNTSVLFEISDRAVLMEEQIKNDDDDGETPLDGLFNSIDNVPTVIREIVEKAKHCDNRDLRFRARVFDYSTNRYKNARQFSKASGIPPHVCWRAMIDFKKYLAEQLNDIHLNRAG